VVHGQVIHIDNAGESLLQLETLEARPFMDPEVVDLGGRVLVGINYRADSRDNSDGPFYATYLLYSVSIESSDVELIYQSDSFAVMSIGHSCKYKIDVIRGDGAIVSSIIFRYVGDQVELEVEKVFEMDL
jgi:hypothetical protein